MCTVNTRAEIKSTDPAVTKSVFLDEGGRSGRFVWKWGDYSAKVAADPMEGIFIASDLIPSTVGAWVREAGYFVSGVSIRWLGAEPASAPEETTAAIQSAMNICAFVGAGKTVVPGDTWHVSKTQTETYQARGMPQGKGDYYALRVPSGVMLEGEGFLSILKRMVPEPLLIVLCAETVGSKCTNLRVDGNHREFPVFGETYGSGAGVFVESGTGSEDRNNLFDTIWVHDTPGYGMGVEWGNHRGLVIKNIFITGTGSDGIDIKRMKSGAFDAHAIVLDTIIVEDFGRTATDGMQAGVDLRGYFTASNIHVRGFGAQARSGIRFRGGIEADGVIGAMRSSLTGFRVEKASDVEQTTYGLEINCDYVSASDGAVDGCTENVSFVLAGKATSASGVALANVKSFNAGTYGFRVRKEFRGTRLTNCSDIQTKTVTNNAGFRIEGTDTKLISPYVRALPGLTSAIIIASTAKNTGVVQPSFEGAAGVNIRDYGLDTVVS